MNINNIYIISWFGNESKLRQFRKEIHKKQLDWARTNGLKITVLAQDYEPDDYEQDVVYVHSDKFLRPCGARNTLMEKFYTSDEDYAIFADNDTVIVDEVWGEPNRFIEDLRKLSDDDLRKAVVMVTQEAYLFSGTVAENISLGKPEATQEEIENSAKAVGAHEFILSLPDGYDTDVNKRGGRVSAGQRQLISFARAFIADPTVLILDEATSSLDIPSERMVQKGLQTLLAGRTAIIIAHRLSTVSIADRVVVMEHGQIIEDDTPATLIAGTGKFAKMHKAWRDSLV
jgi:ABC-type polar amino acid transport system ATPase subunit